MLSLRESIIISKLHEDWIGAFTDEQIEAAEYYKVSQLHDLSGYDIQLYNDAGESLGSVVTSSIDAACAYLEELFDIEDDEIEIE